MSPRFIGYSARICDLPGTCRYSGDLLRKWSSRWIFKNPALIVGGGVGRETMRSMDKTSGQFGVKAIRRLVSAGGTYIGVCNGAYIAGTRCRYNDYVGPRISHGGIGLLRGTTMGPVFSFPSGGSEIDITDAFGQKHRVWYQNGGTFPAIGRDKSYRVRAIYHDPDFPAVVSFRYGEGVVVLSGIHPEYGGIHPEYGNTTNYRLFDHILSSMDVVV